MPSVNNELISWHACCIAYLIPTTMIEQTMHAINKTAKTILNALAFANVSNLDEFRALLLKIDAPTSPDHESAQHGAISSSSGSYAGTPVIGRIQGAL